MFFPPWCLLHSGNFPPAEKSSNLLEAEGGFAWDDVQMQSSCFNWDHFYLEWGMECVSESRNRYMDVIIGEGYFLMYFWNNIYTAVLMIQKQPRECLSPHPALLNSFAIANIILAAYNPRTLIWLSEEQILSKISITISASPVTFIFIYLFIKENLTHHTHHIQASVTASHI